MQPSRAERVSGHSGTGLRCDQERAGRQHLRSPKQWDERDQRSGRVRSVEFPASLSSDFFTGGVVVPRGAWLKSLICHRIRGLACPVRAGVSARQRHRAHRLAARPCRYGSSKGAPRTPSCRTATLHPTRRRVGGNCARKRATCVRPRHACRWRTPNGNSASTATPGTCCALTQSVNAASRRRSRRGLRSRGIGLPLPPQGRSSPQGMRSRGLPRGATRRDRRSPASRDPAAASPGPAYPSGSG